MKIINMLIQDASYNFKIHLNFIFLQFLIDFFFAIFKITINFHFLEKILMWGDIIRRHTLSTYLLRYDGRLMGYEVLPYTNDCQHFAQFYSWNLNLFKTETFPVSIYYMCKLTESSNPPLHTLVVLLFGCNADSIIIVNIFRYDLSELDVESLIFFGDSLVILMSNLVFKDNK